MRIPLSLPAARPLDVLAVGLNSIDLIAVIEGHPAADAKTEMFGFAELPGGQSASAAAAMARLGLKTSYIGRIGDDDFGRRGLDSLRAEGVDVAHVVTVPGATSQFAFILVDRLSGKRTVVWNRHPGLSMAPSDVPPAAVLAARVLHVDCHETATVAAAAAVARSAGTRTVIDVERVQPGTDELLRHIDVIIAAEEFPAAYTGVTSLGAALATMQRTTGAPVVCATLGEEGSLCLAGGREIRTPAFRVQVVDSTGAGDVFRSGFIAGWLHGGPEAELEEALRWANAVAAMKCLGHGARAACPTGPQLHAFLAGRM
ncbi:MAG TPA: PfkB family carbohydrate kinase [Vicinamibacterales bacterium]|nr:PfkB family carbohydrate kinase [Vicinamibacterales bacterium]